MNRHWKAFMAFAFAGAVLDLLTKHLAFKYLASNEEVVIIDGFFEFGKTKNYGIVFGLFPHASRVFLWVSILAVPAIVAIFASLKKPRWVMTVSLALILAGTIGNMYDRITEGAVRDFIKFYVPSLKSWPPRMVPWPLFNIADSCICVGVALLSLEMLFFDEKKKAAKKEPDVPQGPTEPMVTAGAPPVPQGPTEPVPKAEPPGRTTAP
jgi:signal peptidase II